jgi:ankyrin repeat protein
MMPTETTRSLFQFVESGDLGDAKIALAAGADPTAKDDQGWTPLHWAAKKGYNDLAWVLIEGGAELTAKSERGWTPLHFAAANGNVHLVRLLLEKGADPSARDERGETPANWASRHGHTSILMLLQGAPEPQLEHASLITRCRAKDEPQRGG